MATTKSFHLQFSYFYSDNKNDSASSDMSFSSPSELYYYINSQVTEAFNELGDFQDSHCGPDGQVLQLVILEICNTNGLMANSMMQDVAIFTLYKSDRSE